MIDFLYIIILAFAQSVSFSLVSRSRNRDNMSYLVVASMLSNTLWFFCMRELILADMAPLLLPAYMIGTVSGTVYGTKVSMKIEKWLGASTDSHLNKNKVK